MTTDIELQSPLRDYGLRKWVWCRGGWGNVLWFRIFGVRVTLVKNWRPS